ncbi:MAG: DUF2971 domain-containing protein [Veillonellales bacterium]
MIFKTDDIKYLYHYTKLETALEKIIPSKKLRLSNFTDTNDPRESKTWYFEMDNGINIPSMYDNKKGMWWQHLTKCLKHPCRILSFSLDSPPIESIDLYQGDHRPRMWAQYADNHRGICFVFNREKLINTAKTIFADKGKLFYGKVDYDIRNDALRPDELTINPEYFIKQEYEKLIDIMLSDNHYRSYLFRKHIDWKSENEYRIIFRGNNPETYEYLPIEGSLVKITLGVDFPKVYIPLIESFCKKMKIAYDKVVWYNGVPYSDPEIFCNKD